MKKIFLAAIVALGTTTIMNNLPNQQLQASAKAYDMKPSFAKTLKKGTLPRAVGKIGMTYGALKVKAPYGEEIWPMTIYGIPIYSTPNQTNTKNNAAKEDSYGFYNSKFYNKYFEYKVYDENIELTGKPKKFKLSNNEKIDYIDRRYNYVISEKSIRKYFGKELKVKDRFGEIIKDTDIYKAGNYYICIYSDTYQKPFTDVIVATKPAMLKHFTYKKIYN